jgi:hypothetical protein
MANTNACTYLPPASSVGVDLARAAAQTHVAVVHHSCACGDQDKDRQIFRARDCDEIADYGYY